MSIRTQLFSDPGGHDRAKRWEAAYQRSHLAGDVADLMMEANREMAAALKAARVYRAHVNPSNVDKPAWDPDSAEDYCVCGHAEHWHTSNGCMGGAPGSPCGCKTRAEIAEADLAGEAQAWESAADGYRRMFDEQCSRAQRFRSLLALFVDDEECRFDHHGNCQNHGIDWDDTSPGECSMVAVRAALHPPAVSVVEPQPAEEDS